MRGPGEARETVEADQEKYLYQRLLLALSFQRQENDLQECYLGRIISLLRSTHIYYLCVPHLPMFKHPPFTSWLFPSRKKKKENRLTINGGPFPGTSNTVYYRSISSKLALA